ncbi:MAG: hypothetical protein HOK63_02405 [Thaumarchaeota archaeon]|jgi:hypothetical protein|nr:hypothetical protein [Nitrososphaerota archaeon]MBT5843101.1 hypothetical protein [Nitrososphaerota archaeon]MBT6468490.1 hypothetical protein [Nitrososphaerota archaeon]
MDNLDNAKTLHNRNKSDIVNLVKEMFAEDKWGDEKYRESLEALVTLDVELVNEVTRIIKEKHAND